MCFLTIDNLEDSFPSSVEIDSIADNGITISIDINKLPKCENIKMYLNSRIGRLKDAVIVSESVYSEYIDRDYSNVSSTDDVTVIYTKENMPVVDIPGLKCRSKKNTRKRKKSAGTDVSESCEIVDDVPVDDVDELDAIEVVEDESSEAEVLSDDNYICDEYGDYNTGDDICEVDEDDVKEDKKEKKQKAPKVKYARRTGRLVEQIPTPTCTGNVAPTLMATGYGAATYKNLYSVGHFPKLGILEVWEDDEVTNMTPVPEFENTQVERDMTVNVNSEDSGVLNADSLSVHYETVMNVDANEVEIEKTKKQILVSSDVNSADSIKSVYGKVKNAMGAEPLF